ncbi:MAG: YfcC family protein, partial [Peptococcaceae bacterium]|nr:YfcC family protein [Peptococcaceae bacterium]
MKKFPNSFVILLSLICLACAMTWLIPAGSYEKFMDASGITQISTDSFIFVEQTPVNPFELPFYVVEGFVKNVDLILILLFSGGAFEIVNALGALQALITNIASAFQTKKILLLIILTTAFAVVCSSQALHVFIPFVPILVMLTVSLGYDSITGAAIVILGGGIGFSTGTIRTTTTLVAQKIAGLPLYSGLGFRIVCLVVFLIPTCAYLCWYAKKIEYKPEASPMYDLDSQLFTSEDRKKGA